MLKSAVRTIARVLVGGGLAATLVKGIGGGIVASIGWKIGGDLYEALKRKMGTGPASEEESEEKQG